MSLFRRNRNWGLTVLAVYLLIAGLDHFLGLRFLPNELGPALMIAAGALILLDR
ncbi:hypothetical protein [Thalassoroseus pseudoceratinae]|uniref:hypothetical protein n=1 Tax=Thalassoroseus pseudoceratinae TaxID=2713176 RepID=UPI0014224E55|nr:hypothetical protein [Thalassoroseus pseudoceratinae]